MTHVGGRTTGSPRLWEDWLRLVGPWEQRLQRTWILVAIGVAATSVLAVATLPLGLWYGLGPERFDGLDLGAAPPTFDPAELPTGDLADPSVTPQVDRLAPEVPLDFGPNVRVTLLFSVGSRGLTDEDATDLGIADADERGEDGLTDVLMLVIADTDTGAVALLSLPRDLWLPSRSSRINAVWAREGTQSLVDTVADVVGMPINHLAQVNFTAFAELVDRIDGVAVSTDRALADFSSNLFIPAAGCWRLDGAAALAYVRSRKTLTLRDGRWVTDPSASDFGRIARQQQLLRSAYDQLRGPQLIRRIPDLLAVARSGLIVDSGLGLVELRALAGAFQSVSGGAFEGYTVPTNNRRINGAAVLVPQPDATRELMQRLRSWPPTDAAPVVGTPDVPLAAGPWPGASSVVAQGDAGCSLGLARDLPDPGPALLEVFRSRDGSTGDGRPEPEARPDEPSDTPPTTDEQDPTPAPEDTGSPGPSEPPPSEDPSPEPSGPSEEPEPEPSSSEPGLLDDPPLP